MRIALAFLFLHIFSAQAFCMEKLFAEPCARAGIPASLALAIARQESGLHPWCINVQGKDYVPKTYDEAVRVIRQARAAGKSYDVGIMQINSQWTRKWKLDPLELLDPARNIALGIKILKQEIARHGMNWQAVGKYHSPNPERGRKYAWRVYKKIKDNKYGKTLLAARETQNVNGNNPLHKSGIWRNSGIERKGRLITF